MSGQAPRPEVVVYRGSDQTVEIGPRHAWLVNERVSVPRRERAWPHSDVVEAFEAMVFGVDSDGVARARRVEDGVAP